jgi:cytochrome c oxidase subunit 2
MVMRKLASGAALAAAALMSAGGAFAADLLGQPTPGAIDFQPAASPLKHQVIFFHNVILLPIITAMVLLVLGLLIYCIVRFNRRANPTPAKWSHNTMIEVIWTSGPVLILMFIAIFSFKLLYAYHDMPKPDLTVKVTGYQWYWGYAYPDQKIDEITSTLMPEDEAKAKGLPFRLAANNPMVVPVGKVVRVLVTGADVIHSWANPAFGTKIDAVPGRVNETWFKAEKVGVYYGQCSELCGIDHAFMPSEVDVVSQADFDKWVATHSAQPAAATPSTLNAAGNTNAPAPGPGSSGAVPAAPAQKPGVDVNPAAPPKASPAATKASFKTVSPGQSVKLAALN